MPERLTPEEMERLQRAYDLRDATLSAGEFSLAGWLPHVPVQEDAPLEIIISPGALKGLRNVRLRLLDPQYISRRVQQLLADRGRR